MAPRSRNTIFGALLVLAAGAMMLAHAGESPAPRKIAVFGSSVASGAVDHQDKGGYAGRLGQLLQPRGWEVVNVSRGGDNTVKIAPRFEAQLVPQQAGYVLIGLSLANEGLVKPGDKAHYDHVYEQWRTGMLGLIQRCRDAGMRVVVGNCYAHASFAANPALYAYTRRMNLEISTWDVPSVDFLGAIDDGHGAWMAGFEADAGHPNGFGHQEMFRAIVPSLFEALEAGKPTPVQASSGRYARLTPATVQEPALAFAPAGPVHSFSVSFRVRPHADGILAAISGKTAQARQETWQRGEKTLSATLIEAGEAWAACLIAARGGDILYQGADGSSAGTPFGGGDNWHHVCLSHSCARGVSTLYVDGRAILTASERILPERFSLGCGAEADVRDWCIYRSALNADEVKLLADGGLFQSSLEVYCPLDDKAFALNTAIENRAQSMAEVKVLSDCLTPAGP